MTPLLRFTKIDAVHAALGVIPAFALVATGHLTFGAAFAIGLLPTSLMGIAASRRQRVVHGVTGCLFGLGVLIGALLISIPNILLVCALFISISLAATVVASRRVAGGLLLSIILPSLAVGTGYAVHEAAALMATFSLGYIWSCLVMLPRAEFASDPTLGPKLAALQPKHVKTYGLLLGLTLSTAFLLGRGFDIPYYGWIATAAMLVIRPVQEMTRWRGMGRALSTIAGTLLVAVSVHLDLGHLATAGLVAGIAILTIGARTSRLYVTSFGTAFLILTIELQDVAGADLARSVGLYRIVNNVLGALIAIFYGLVVARLLEHWSAAGRSTPAETEG